MIMIYLFLTKNDLKQLIKFLKIIKIIIKKWLLSDIDDLHVELKLIIINDEMYLYMMLIINSSI